MTSERRTFARDVALVARFELAESLRSRLLAVMILVFVGSGALSAWTYSAFVQEAEDRAADVLGAPSAGKPGAAARRLRDTPSYRQVLRFFVSDEKKADYFAEFPPLVVFYAFASFLVTPWLILFAAAETISSEVAARSIRYALLRTGRLSYALGKAVGQLGLLVGVTALAGLVFYGVAWFRLAGFESGATALGMLGYWPRILLYSLPFLSWALFASMATASANLARIVAVGGAVLLAIASVIAAWSGVESPIGGAALSLLGFITPFGHAEGLRYPRGGALPADLATCLVLTVLYFSAGFAILRRRDV